MTNQYVCYLVTDNKITNILKKENSDLFDLRESNRSRML